jgi:exo-beta-1,3-glucanase (GH17 family)
MAKDKTEEKQALPGVSYAPYKGNHACKTQKEVNEDFSHMKGKYSMVRIYGTDCNQVAMVREAAKANDMKVFLGIWNLKTMAEETDEIIKGMNGEWNMVFAISVGNEVIDRGEASAEEVVEAIKKTRSRVREAGFKGPVVAVNTQAVMEAHSEVCQASDVCALNVHPFFNANTSAEEAGKWVMEAVKRVQALMPKDKKVMVAETGWPTEGQSNGAAVPGKEQQKTALEAISKAYAEHPAELFLFSAFNDLWKAKEAKTFFVEQSWGIDGAVSVADAQASE